jgi:hypothetical protein
MAGLAGLAEEVVFTARSMNVEFESSKKIRAGR